MDSTDNIPSYTGKILRVDLTNERVSEEALDEHTLKTWIGGAGIGAKYLYKEVPLGVEWNDPENRLIAACGPLGGTRVIGSGNICFVTKGCLTNGATSTQANGFMGAFMKFSGYDAVIFQGAARRWVYLYLHDDKAELRDATHLHGKDTWATEDTIRNELGYSENQMSVCCIGPAGENQVKFACIVADKCHFAGRNGVGAVMGSKKLKAICASRSVGKIAVSDPEKLKKSAEVLWETATGPQSVGNFIVKMGTAGPYWRAQERYMTGSLPVKNYTTNLFEKPENISSQYGRERWEYKPKPCWACRAHHDGFITITDGHYKGVTVEEAEYQIFAQFGSQVGNSDVAEILVTAHLVTLLGLEGDEAGFITGMVMELYERGVLTKKDTDGLDLKWGNMTAVKELLKNIAYRKGKLGNILAEGMARAVEVLGQEAKESGVYVMKGNTPYGHDYRAYWFGSFPNAVSDVASPDGIYYGPHDPYVKQIKDRWDPVDIAVSTAASKGKRNFEDCVGACFFTMWGPVQLIVDCVNAVTGWNLTPQEALAAGLRTTNLMRVFNVRHGVSVDKEKLSPRMSSTPVDGPAKGKSIIPIWEMMRDTYYREMGWDKKTGRPLPETLQRLGLDDVVKDIW